jgi:hypothetical protein
VDQVVGASRTQLCQPLNRPWWLYKVLIRRQRMSQQVVQQCITRPCLPCRWVLPFPWKRSCWLHGEATCRASTHLYAMLYCTALCKVTACPYLQRVCCHRVPSATAPERTPSAAAAPEAQGVEGVQLHGVQ